MSHHWLKLLKEIFGKIASGRIAKQYSTFFF
jgi:hypothetical protein